MRILKIFPIVIALVSITCSGNPVNPNDRPITFPDPNFESLIREVLDIPTGEITRGDMSVITELDCNSREISDLSGIGYCTNLTNLNLEFNQINDLSPLSDLIKLVWLNAYNNEISDLSPLSSLAN